MIQEREALQSGVARREDENLCTEEEGGGLRLSQFIYRNKGISKIYGT